MKIFQKRLELVNNTAHFINRAKELNSKCNGEPMIRTSRQIDSALVTAADFGFKQFQKHIISIKLDELMSQHADNLNSESQGKY